MALLSRRRTPSAGGGRLIRAWRGVFLAAASAVLLNPVSAMATVADERAEEARQLQLVVDGVRARLGLDGAVTVSVVEADPHHLSVRPPVEAGAPFVVQVEQAMLVLLTTDEVEAAIAHELGHVWVFTHHPYLQTERLANEVAMRVVSRDTLVRVYEKVWKQDGVKGDLERFLGEPALREAEPGLAPPPGQN
ncbi:MAG: hypothetical protein AB7H81_09675 [Vicinamibacterales bacterium]